MLWITLPTHWEFSSVQAALNVIIAVLGTTGIWAFSRFWWQRATLKVIRSDGIVALPKLLTFTSPGESWDLMTLLRRQLLAKENWHLLAQLLLVVVATAASIFAGPISKVALRNGKTVQRSHVQVLQTVKGAGPALNLLNANVLWNNTIRSMDDAEFPTSQMMDFVPSFTAPWVYEQDEWDPTWQVECNNTDRAPLEDLRGDSNYTFMDPLNAFPAFRNTIDPFWLDARKFRVTTDNCEWIKWNENPDLKHVVFYVLIQSDPQIQDQMHLNQMPLHLSISALHVQDGNITTDSQTIAGKTTYRPVGLFERATYSRFECVITRKPQVDDDDRIPWIWTNDTASIARAYADYNRYPLAERAGQNLTVKTPSGRDLFRFYQAYMASITTNASRPSPRMLSIRLDTVELSLVFLAFILLFFVLTIWATVRYLIFYVRHKRQLTHLYVPDGKIEWMLHAVKTSPTITEEELQRGDREHFRNATIGVDSPLQGVQHPPLARVYSSRVPRSRVRSDGQGSSASDTAVKLPIVLEGLEITKCGKLETEENSGGSFADSAQSTCDPEFLKSFPGEGRVSLSSVDEKLSLSAELASAEPSEEHVPQGAE